MALQAAKRANVRLPPEVNRILYVRNLPYEITAEEMYDIFGKYGAIRQIRLGNASNTKGTAFVVYEDIFDAKNACEHLSGFNMYDLVSRSVDARRIMYDNVIAATKPYTIVQGYGIPDEDLVRNDYKTEAKRLKYEQGMSDAKSMYEKLAEERDRRRRRQKYRAKNIASNRSIKEIYRAIIEKRMAECGAIEEGEHLGGHHSDKDCQLKTVPSGSSRYDGDSRLVETGKLEHHQQHIIGNDDNTFKDHSGRKRYRTTDERGRNQSRSRTSDRDDDEYKRRKESRHSTDLKSTCHEHERHRHKNKHKKHKKH